MPGQLLTIHPNREASKNGGVNDIISDDIEGLSEGDEVATQATFLLSSEAQLRGALPRWSRP